MTIPESGWPFLGAIRGLRASRPSLTVGEVRVLNCRTYLVLSKGEVRA